MNKIIFGIIIILILFCFSTFSTLFAQNNISDKEIKRAKFGLEMLTSPGNYDYFKRITYPEVIEIIDYANKISSQVVDDEVWQAYIANLYSNKTIKAILWHNKIKAECSNEVGYIEEAIIKYRDFKRKSMKKDVNESSLQNFALQITSLRQSVENKIRNLLHKIETYRQAAMSNSIDGGFMNPDPRVRLIFVDVVRRLIPTADVRNKIKQMSLIKVGTSNNEIVETVQQNSYFYTDVNNLNLEWINDKRVIYKEFESLYKYSLRKSLERSMKTANIGILTDQTHQDEYFELLTKPIDKEGFSKIPFNKNNFKSEKELKNYIQFYTQGMTLVNNVKIKQACADALITLIRTQNIDEKLKIEMLKTLVNNTVCRNKVVTNILTKEQNDQINETAEDKTSNLKSNVNVEEAKNKVISYLKEKFEGQTISQLNNLRNETANLIMHRLLDKFIEIQKEIKPALSYSADQYDEPDSSDFIPPKYKDQPVDYQKLIGELQTEIEYKQKKAEEAEAASEKVITVEPKTEEPKMKMNIEPPKEGEAPVTNINPLEELELKYYEEK